MTRHSGHITPGQTHLTRYQLPLDGAFGKECAGADTTPNANQDIQKGSQIVVKDNKGSVLGTSVLEQGAIANLSFNGSCEFPFSIQILPQNDFYTVEVGNRTVILSKQTLEASSWKADLVIASNSLQVNSASIDEKTLKESDAIRQVEKTSQKLELERASREETSETKQVKTETCIAQKELAEQWQGEPISKECEQFLKDLETQKP